MTIFVEKRGSCWQIFWGCVSWATKMAESISQYEPNWYFLECIKMQNKVKIDYSSIEHFITNFYKSTYFGYDFTRNIRVLWLIYRCIARWVYFIHSDRLSFILTNAFVLLKAHKYFTWPHKLLISLISLKFNKIKWLQRK